MPPLVDAHDPVLPDICREGEIRRQLLSPRSQEKFRGYKNIADSDGPLIFPPLPHDHTFVVTSSLMQMLTSRGLFSGIPSKDPHAHIAKVRVVCKIFVGRLDLNMYAIELRVFRLSLMGEATILFTELPYNSILP